MRGPKGEFERTNFRYNIATTIVYIVGIVLVLQLFNLQIINGEEYRETSNTKLSREGRIEATRGSILDRSGNVLASSTMSFSLELYKTKTGEDVLNNALLTIATVLEKNGDSRIGYFPIAINPFNYVFESEEELNKWRKKYNIPVEASPEEAFYIMKDKYSISNENVEEIYKILTMRYAIANEGYSTTKSIELAGKISRASAVEISERIGNLPGINIVVEPVREYPMGNLASHIIGYIGRITDKELEENIDYEYQNDDYVGKNGIEKVFENYLRGVDGEKQIDMEVDGTITGEYTTKEAIGGDDVILTIDANLQKVTQEALVANIEKIKAGGFGKVYNAQGGAAVVLDVKTGEVLSLVSYPDYNPQDFVNGISTEKWNAYTESKGLYSKALQGAYAPGSVFKMATAIAALESGVVTTKELINDTGVYPLAHKPKCWRYTDYNKGHGLLNVSDAIKHSCNYFFYEVGNRMGIDTLVKYASYFGLGNKTGIELPNETTGTLASKETAENKGDTWSVGSMLSASIGQSYNNFSPLQMAKYIGMVANGGKKLDVTIIKELITPSGSKEPETEINNFVNQKLGLEDSNNEEININQTTIDAVLEGMRSVTDETGGTAYSIFRDFNITVGGKTGSAEAGTFVNAWFAGFAPFENPEIAVVVLVENGGHGYYVAEVVREVIAEYFGMNTQEVIEDMSAEIETELFR